MSTSDSSFAASKALIERSYANLQQLTATEKSELLPEVTQVIAALDQGKLRIANPDPTGWHLNDWLKQAILLYFALQPTQAMAEPGSKLLRWWDKVQLKTANWQAADFQAAGFRAVPGALVRFGAYVARNVVLMPSFVNIGAYIDSGTMVDTWATVGSCAQIGRNVHISGGAGIGGVLEPIQAQPTIIEDDCFIGARSEVAEGVIVEQGAVLAMGVYISASTRIIDRATGEIFYGRVPKQAVVVAGSAPGTSHPDIGLYAAVIVKYVDAQTRKKVGINALLRDVTG